MTADAVFTYGKGRFVIVTCTARLPIFHVVHCRSFPGVPETEYSRMAVGAMVNVYMKCMAEIHRSCSIYLHQYITRPMAAGTVPQGKSSLAVVACAARFAFFHGGHCYGTVPAGFEETRMTITAAPFSGVGRV